MVVLGFVRGMLLASIATAWVQPPPVACNASLRTQQQAPELTEALTRCFPGADSFTTRVATLNDAQRADLTPHLRLRQAPRLWSYTEASQSGALLGRAIAGDVIGKSLPITYLVLLNTDNRVRGVEILNYRESHGGEVRREKWRAQFDGKDATATLKIVILVKRILVSCV